MADVRHALTALCVFLAACKDNGDPFIIQPGGDDGVFIPGADAAMDTAVDDGDVGETIEGRVCLMTDLRDPTSCANAGVGGLEVVLGTSTAVTDVAGVFSMPTPTGTALVWRVTGRDIVPSRMPLSTVNLIPAMSVESFDELLLSNGMIGTEDEGHVFVRAMRSELPLPGVTATAVPSPTYDTHYDGPSSFAWSLGQTGAFGAVWIPSVLAGTVDVTITGPRETTVELSLPVEAHGLTFATVELP